MREQDTVSLLCEWGKWSREGRVNLGSVSASLFVMQLVQPADLRSSVDICDDDALWVDRAVCQLKLYNAQMHEIIELYFLRCLTMKEIELRLKINRSQAEKLFSRSCGWLDCELKVKDKVA